MITILEDGKPIARITLVDGKMQSEILDPLAEEIIDHMKGFRGQDLTDIEAYRLMPFRLTGRISASISGPDAKQLRDPSTYKAKVAEADRRADAR